MQADGHPIALSGFAHAKTNRAIRWDGTWGQWLDSFGAHQVQPIKTDCPMFAPATFTDNVRSKRNVEALYLGALDLDDVPLDNVLHAQKTLASLNTALLFYTSYSHHRAQLTKLWRGRFVFPFSRPVTRQEYRLVWPRIKALFPYADSCIKDPSRGYFGPYVPNVDSLATARIAHTKGQPFDVDALLKVPFETNPDLEVEPGDQPIPRDSLMRIASRYRRRSASEDQTLGEALYSVVKGESFASPGNTDNTAWQLAILLARELPHGDPQSIAEHFAPSIQLQNMQWEEQTGRPGEFTTLKVAEKIERAQRQIKTEQAKKEYEQAEQEKVRVKIAFRAVQLDRDIPYTETEFQHFASIEGCSSSEMRKRWILRKGNSAYFYVNGKYLGPYSCNSDAISAAANFLSPASTIGVQTHVLTKKGDFLAKSIDRLTIEYGQTVNRIVVDTAADRTHFVPETGEIIEAPFALRPLSPEYNHEVHTWLKLMGGNKAPQLLQWVADITNLQHPCVMLFLYGAGNAGKSFLARGLSRLFSEGGPTSLEKAMGRFNDAVLYNPILFGDERLPTDYRGRVRWDDLRELIQSSDRPLERKFQAVATMRGAIRIISAANSENLLTQGGDLTADDIGAIAERVLTIYVGATGQCRPAKYLKATKHRHWIKQDTMAKHALWLRDNYKWIPQGRFRVKDPDTRLTRSLTTRTGARFYLCMFLVRYLLNPKPADTAANGDFLITGNRLYTRTKTVQQFWQLYVRHDNCPKAVSLGRAMSGIAKGRKKFNNGDGFKQYWEIDTAHLVNWAEDNNEATEQRILRALAIPTELRKGMIDYDASS